MGCPEFPARALLTTTPAAAAPRTATPATAASRTPSNQKVGGSEGESSLLWRSVTLLGHKHLTNLLYIIVGQRRVFQEMAPLFVWEAKTELAS